jgi:hypothetical protein
MAITTSGGLSLNDIQTELGGSNPIGINEYYHPNGDPFLPTPFPFFATHHTEPVISLNDFNGADGKTTQITCARSADTDDSGKARGGFQTYKGGLFQFASGESGSSFNSFGSVSRSITFTTGQALIGLYYQDSFSPPGNPNDDIYIVKRGSGNNGWTSMGFRYNDKTAAYGDPSAQHGYHPHGSAQANYDRTLYRSQAAEFNFISGSNVNGDFAYYWRFRSTGTNGAAIQSIYRAMRGAAHSQTVSSSSGVIAIKIS